MFCPKCGSNQEDRRFCTVCGTNLAAVSQALHAPAGVQIPSPMPLTTPYPAQPPLRHLLPHEMERQREYASGMKMLVIGGAFLGYNILKVLFSFGHANFGFWGVISLIVFAVGLSKVLSWKQVAGVTTNAVLQTMPPQSVATPMPAPAPNTAQLQTSRPGTAHPPQPVFSAPPPALRTDEIEPARYTAQATANLPPYASVMPSVIEDETRRLADQQAQSKPDPAGSQANWKTE